MLTFCILKQQRPMYRHRKITLWFLFDVVKITDPFAGNTGDSDIKYCSTVARVFAETSGITKIRFGTYHNIQNEGGYKIETLNLCFRSCWNLGRQNVAQIQLSNDRPCPLRRSTADVPSFSLTLTLFWIT